MGAVERFRSVLAEQQLDDSIVAQIMEGYERISDSSTKERRAAFFQHAIQCMDAQLDFETRRGIRDACACSKGGWRLKAVEKLAKEYAGQDLQAKVAALWQIKYMGEPTLHEDGTITAGIGGPGGLTCPCPVFSEGAPQEPVSLTYCYCCAGHFRHHYQIALGVKLITEEVASSALHSGGKQPCRFVYKIVE